jgi:hypothetical protein
MTTVEVATCTEVNTAETARVKGIKRFKETEEPKYKWLKKQGDIMTKIRPEET